MHSKSACHCFKSIDIWRWKKYPIVNSAGIKDRSKHIIHFCFNTLLNCTASFYKSYWMSALWMFFVQGRNLFLELINIHKIIFCGKINCATLRQYAYNVILRVRWLSYTIDWRTAPMQNVYCTVCQLPYISNPMAFM